MFRIYVDTSVFGGCFDPEFEIWSNRLMKDFIERKYIAVISEISEFELNLAPEHVKAVLKKIPENNIEVVKLSDEARILSELYIKEKIVSKKSL